MKNSLIEEGLYAEEADAMLKTWEVSYFKSPGQRLFFIVPRAWTDHQLPLQLSIPARISRVMIGRIELVTPGQRLLLRQIADGSVPAEPADTGMPDAYRQLGRFRNALLLAEYLSRPTEALSGFIMRHHISREEVPPGVGAKDEER